METAAHNRVFYRLAGRRDGHDGDDIVLIGDSCTCGGIHEGAAPGCHGNPAFGWLWAAGARSDDLTAYGADIPLVPLTVLDAVGAVAREDGLSVLRASLAACRLMVAEVFLLDHGHHHDEADELRLNADHLRRQIPVAVIHGDLPHLPVELWREIVELDASFATDWQHSLKDKCLCGHDHGRHSQGGVSRRHSARVQTRNELCACGSGRKYKHCHGR
jgi:hypothetical protein